MPRHQYLWIDFECTGLKEREGLILEFAAVLCEDARGGSFEVVEAHENVIAYPGFGRADLMSLMDPFVQNMHTQNGLIDEVLNAAADGGMDLGDADEYLAELCDRLLKGGDPKARVTLAGGSVHFDKKWAEHHMPEFAKRLHYRVHDVSTLKAQERVHGGPFDDIKGDNHRAMSDVLASIEEAKALRDRRFL
jgi:oligoribonuclease